MRMTRRQACWFASVGLAAVSTSGCTAMVWNDNRHERVYTEAVDAVYIAADRRTLVVLGPQQHYVFDLPRTLAAVFESPLFPKVRGQFSSFDLSRTGGIAGQVVLTLRDATEAEANLATTTLGFGAATNPGGAGRVLRLELPLSGQVYRKDPAKPLPVGKRQELNQRHTIQVIAPDKADAVLRKLALTPVAVAADGVGLVLFGIPLLILTGGNAGQLFAR